MALPGPDVELERVTLDANVVYPIGLIDYLLWAAASHAFQPVRSEDILEEARRNLVENGYPDAPRRIARMKAAFPGADPGTRQIKRQLGRVPAGVDAGDHHVVATALAAGSALLVTNNSKHFPVKHMKWLGIRRLTAEQFLQYLWQGHRDAMVQALRDGAASKKSPPQDTADFLAAIARSCPTFARAAAAELRLELPG